MASEDGTVKNIGMTISFMESLAAVLNVIFLIISVTGRGGLELKTREVL